MDPQLAVVICVAFILFSFILDNRYHEKLSVGNYLPLLWVLKITSRPVAMWINPSIGTELTPDAYLSGSPIDRNIYIGLILFGIIVLIKRKLEIKTLIKENVFLFLFFLYCFISIAWSDFPVVSMKRYVKAIGNLIMVLIVLSDTNRIEATKALFRRLNYINIPLSVLFIKYFPAIGRKTHRWTYEIIYVGVASGKNQLGHLCFVCGLFLFWSFLEELQREKNNTIFRINYVIFFFLIYWLLRKADSATSSISLLAGVLLMVLSKRNFFQMHIIRYSRAIVLFAIGISLFILIFSRCLPTSFIAATGHSETFWGRIDFWHVVIGMAGSPIVGAGYDSFFLGDRMEKLWKMYYWHPTEAHNGYLGIFLDLGIVGVIMLLLAQYKGFETNVLKALKENNWYGRVLLTFFVSSLLYNITESAFKGLHIVWFGFLLVIMSYSPSFPFMRRPFESEDCCNAKWQ